MSDRIPPHSIEAEESLLGAMMLSRDAIVAATAKLLPDAFYVVSHQRVYQAIVACYGAREKVDPIVVADELTRQGDLESIVVRGVKHGTTVRGRQALLTLQSRTPASANASEYIDIVGKLAAKRTAIMLAAEIDAAAYDDTVAADAVVTLAERMADRIVLPSRATEPGVDLDALIAMEFDYRWIVPGMIRRGDRMILTGLEGFSGKTEFNFQLGLQFACGVHPWTQRPEYAPVNVLYLDFENALDQLQPRARRLRKVAGELYETGRLVIRAYPAGINLREPSGWGFIDSLCEQHSPQVVIIGPIYRTFDGSRGMPKHSEEVAEEVTKALDRIRLRHDVALIMEAHSPHGDNNDRAGYRPYGASLWKRWPEMGVGLAPRQVRENKRMVTLPGHFTFEWWRGTRDQDLRRPWPVGVRRHHTWSFIPIDELEEQGMFGGDDG